MTWMSAAAARAGADRKTRQSALIWTTRPSQCMKSVAIFRHAASEGPGYFATYLDRHRVPWEIVKVDEGAAIPSDPRDFSGLAFMGGPMSVNDDLPWIAPALGLIRAAAGRGVPTLGHCLGGQLIARALGGA